MCPEAWYLARRGVRQEVHSAVRVERGVRAHKRIGAHTDRLQRLDRTRRLVVIFIVVLVVAAAAQLIGAVIGAALLALVLAGNVEGDLGAHSLGNALSSKGAGVIVEAILTFVLVFTVFATAVDRRGLGNAAPIAIGFAILIDHFIGVPLTGASMNPARSFGPALVANAWSDHWVYWVGPLLGAAMAGLFYHFVFLVPAEKQEA